MINSKPLATQGTKDPPEDAEADKWERLVSRILAGDWAAQEELYNAFARSLRFFFTFHLQTDEVEDKLQDTFVAVVTAIRAGQVREPARLPGFIRTIAHRLAAGYVAELAYRSSEPIEMLTNGARAPQAGDPEREILLEEQQQLAHKLMKTLPEIDRQILRRFYVDGHTAEQISQDLGITLTQFRVRKFRAKKRVSDLARAVVKKKYPGQKISLRKQAASGH